MAVSVFNHPTKIIYGVDSLYKLENELKTLKCKSLFVVSGKKFLENSGTKEKLLSILKNFDIYFFNRVIPNPPSDVIEEAVKILVAQKFDAAIGIGGGSAIDCAKLSLAVFNAGANVKDLLYGKSPVLKRPIPLIAVPTTSGTGSEVTPFVTVRDKQLNKKIALGSYFLYPEIAIIDPKLTFQMPPHITASTALDAISHAFESLWSKDSQPITDIFAEESIKLIFENIDYAVRCDCAVLDERAQEARVNMSMASMLAGIAISHTRAGASDAISYPIAVYSNITHGFACALTLGEVLKLNYPFLSKKFDKIFSRLDIKDIEEMKGKIDSLKKNLSAPCSLRELGIKEENISDIAEQSFDHPAMQKNIAPLTKKDIENILKTIY